MSTLIEVLERQIARLEAKHGPSDPYVTDLKEQLRASKATQGKTAKEVYLMQAQPLNKPSTPTSPSETEADGKKAEALRRLKARRASTAPRGRTPA